jgi:hypothetical protein
LVGIPLILWLSAQDHAEIARVLLEAGAKVDGGDTPALFTACALEKIELVRLLLKHGASYDSYTLSLLLRCLTFCDISPVALRSSIPRFLLAFIFVFDLGCLSYILLPVQALCRGQEAEDRSYPHHRR